MFREFARAVEARYSHIAKHELFVVDVENLFETYLAAFPEGSNPMFRTRTVHDCQCCKQFVRRLGKVVAIVGGKVLTVWDDPDVPGPYKEVTAAMAAAVRSAPVKTVFRTKERSYGVSHNFDTETHERHDYFVGTVLPKAKSVAVLVENRHVGNFVSLTAPKTDDGSRLFKWNNPFAWSYDGDVTDSVKQRVKAAGGNIDAKLRVSLSWFNFDDLDLHARTPDSSHVYFGNKCGILDVDMNAGSGHTRNAVENLAFNRLKDGVYSVWVNQFNRRETADVGFEIELEFGGVVRQFSYGKAVSGDVQCLTLHVSKGVLTRVDSPLTEGSTSQEKWGVHTETAVPVTAVMFSPNHWGDQKVGARHLIFALENCKNPTSARGIYNEFLRADLDKHRKVFEILGNKTKCAPADEQISGVGFTAARGDYVTAVVDGKRTYLVTF